MPYLGRSPTQAVRARYYYTVASGATSVTGSDDNSNTLIFSDGEFVDVSLNGVTLVAGTDYVTTTANTIGSLSAMSANDVVEVVVYDVFSVFDGNVNSDFSIGGTLNVASGAVFNEDSADVDFRVESNGNANMLFVDGGNDAIGIKSNNPAFFGSLAIRGAIDTASGNNHGVVSASFSDAITGTFSIAHASGLVSLLTDQKFAFVTATNKVAMNIDTTGAVTKPLQPAFQAIPASDQTNFAVNAAVVVVFGTEIFDQNADFASNTFTAPITGKYQLDVNVRLENIDSASTSYHLSLDTSNRGYTFDFDPDFGQDNALYTMSISTLADMDAGDTAIVRIVQASGTAQTDIGIESFFSGFLAC